MFPGMISCALPWAIHLQVADLTHEDRDPVALSADLGADRRSRPPRTPRRMTQVNGTNELMTQIHDA